MFEKIFENPIFQNSGVKFARAGCHASAKPVPRIRAGMFFEIGNTCLRKS